MSTAAPVRPNLAQPLLALIGFLLLSALVAGLGGWLTALGVRDWYSTLNKPTWNPPNTVFGPVWTTLYVMMALAAWLVWRERGWREPALRWNLLQLLLNAGWSGLFFAMQRPDLAFVEIVLLWLAILVTLVLFWRIRPLAGMMLVPYLLWVTFAGLLNFTLWRLNS